MLSNLLDLLATKSPKILTKEHRKKIIEAKIYPNESIIEEKTVKSLKYSFPII